MTSRKGPGRRLSPWLVLLGLPLAGSLALVSCSKETPTPEQPRPAQANAPGQAGPAARPASEGEPAANEPSAAASDRFKEANFELSIEPKGSYASGQEGKVEIVLQAKEPFHVNDKYPYKFKLRDSAGVKFASNVVKQDAVKLEKSRAVMSVAFVPESAGKKQIAGQFSFSVCTDEKCLIEKRELSLGVDVK
jgi:hypothetical protein